MRSYVSYSVSFVLGLVVLTAGTWGWSYKEHVLFTRMAVLRLLNDPTVPSEMKAWLRQAAGDLPDLAGMEDFFLHARVGAKPQGFTGIAYWSCVPDVHAMNDAPDQKIEPFGVHERVLHYIDLELFNSDPSRRQYVDDLSNKPAISDIPRDLSDERFAKAGMLPFRIEHCYRHLVEAIAAGRLHAPTTQQQEEAGTATYWAGYLSHYLADNTQPHHATIDYKSQSYFPNDDRSRAPNIHAEMEYRMCDDQANDFMTLRKEYWSQFVQQLEQFEDPIGTADPWRASVEVSLRSYDALPLIGRAAVQAAKPGATEGHVRGQPPQFDTEVFFRFRGRYMDCEMSVLEMKAIQTAWAVKRIERTLRQAWEQASGGK